MRVCVCVCVRGPNRETVMLCACRKFQIFYSSIIAEGSVHISSYCALLCTCSMLNVDGRKVEAFAQFDFTKLL